MDPTPNERPEEELRGLRGSVLGTEHTRTKVKKDTRTVQEFWQDEKSKVIEGHGKFLGTYRWYIYAVLRVGADHGLSFERARNMVRRWIALWGPETSAYFSYEQGPITGLGHINVLLHGKLQHGTVHQINGSWVWRYQVHHFPITSWSWGYGEIPVHVEYIELYHPRRGLGAEYLSKGTFDHPEYADFIGAPPQRHRRRTR